MKKYLTVILFAPLFISCQNKATLSDKTSIARDSIKAYLMLHLNDPKSYEPVGFDSLERKMSTYLSDDHYFEYDSWANSISSVESDDMLKDFKVYKSRTASGYYKKLKQKGSEGLDSLKKAYKPKFLGYTMMHTYRAKNGFGALTLHTTTFKLDTNLSVWDVKELN